MSSSFILSIDRTLSDVTTAGQGGPGSDGNERVLRISQSSSITEPLASYLVSYQDTHWGSRDPVGVLCIPNTHTHTHTQ